MLQQHRSVSVAHPTASQQLFSSRATSRCRLRSCCSSSDAAAPSVETPLATDVDQPASMTIPAPLSPTEPPNDDPKKQSPHARLSENLHSTSITIIGDDTELIWAVCQALSKKIGWFPVSTSKILLGLHKASSIQELIDKQGYEAVGELSTRLLLSRAVAA